MNELFGLKFEQSTANVHAVYDRYTNLIPTLLFMKNVKMFILMFATTLFAQSMQANNQYRQQQYDSHANILAEMLVPYEAEWTSGNTTATSPLDGVKLVLIGVVYQRGTTIPLSSATVQLEDKSDKSKLTYRTTADGTFYFRLEPDKQYQLYALNSKNMIEDTKVVKTINKKEPEIFRAILEVDADNAAVAPMLVQKAMESTKSPQTASAIDMPNSKSGGGLSFKVQLGAFKEVLPAKSPFLTNTKEKISTENTGNGYIRYMAGEFASLKEATEYMNQLKAKNYDKVFIVPYYKGERKKETPEEAVKKYK